MWSVKPQRTISSVGYFCRQGFRTQISSSVQCGCSRGALLLLFHLEDVGDGAFLGFGGALGDVVPQ